MNQEIHKIINNENDIKQEVLKKIHAGEVHMKSKTYFILRLGIMFFVIFFIVIISIFILSYVLFSLKTGGNLSLLTFGSQGLYRFIIGLPWILLAFDIILLVFLDKLLKTFSFGYKSPILYLFIFTLVFITIISTLVNLTSFHGRMMRGAGNNGLPFLPKMYDGIRKPSKGPDIFRGYVKSVNNDYFTVAFDGSGGNSDVLKVSMQTSFNIEDYLSVGDYVFIAGRVKDGEIKAYGVKKLDN